MRRLQFLTALLLCSAGLGPAFALAENEPAAGELTPDARTELNFSAIVVSFENDKFFAGSDRHYTQGARITFLYDGGPKNPLTMTAQKILEEVNRTFLFKSNTRIERGKLAVALGQDIFTPGDTETAALLPNDRPYAGWLYVAAGFHAIEGNTSYVAELTLGMVGPAAQGERFQNGWHDVINVAPANGWHHQLRNEPGLNLAFEWRTKLINTDWLDVIPRAAIVLGNVYTHASGGAMLRVGPHLPADFGHDLIRAGSGAIDKPRRFSAYAFIAADVRAVARNIFLDGNTWRDSHSVRKRPVVADVNAGLALNWPSFRLIYTQDYRTKDFYGQPKRDVFGSVSLAWLF